MLPEIRKGDTVECINCKRPIKLTNETFTMDFVAEYISCNHCGIKADVQEFHKYSRKIDKIVYRPHRGGIDEAMEESQEFDSIDDILQYVCDHASNFMDKENFFEPCDLHYEFYHGADERIGWNNCFVVTLNSYENVKNKEHYLMYTGGAKYEYPCVVFGFFSTDYAENYKEVFKNWLESIK